MLANTRIPAPSYCVASHVCTTNILLHACLAWQPFLHCCNSQQLLSDVFGSTICIAYSLGTCSFALQAAGNHAVQGLFQKFRFMQSSTKHFNVLEDVSAIIPPGRMTLLLGPPGSGKSTLLAALAGKLQASNLKVSTLTPSALFLLLSPPPETPPTHPLPGP